MKVLAIIAFISLQMSMFACASNAHMYTANQDFGTNVEHVYAHTNGDHNVNPVNEVHASSHTFVSLEEVGMSHPEIITKAKFTVSKYLFTHLPKLIDQPPKA